MNMKWFGVVAAAAGLLLISGLSPVRAEEMGAPQSQPVPRPFPNSGTARPAAPAPSTPDASAPAPNEPPTVPQPAVQPPAPAPDRTGRPAPAAAQAPPGTPVYPTAEFIDSFDAGTGQRYYLYGTNAAYADIVAYYRNLLKNGGRELYKIPPMQQFDLGRFDEEAMAYPPSVVVKDYTWNGSPGYLAVSGTTEKRFKTVIQIVPVTVIR